MIIAFIRSSSFLLLLFSGSGAFQPRPLGLSRSQQTSKINYIEDEKATEVEVLKTTKQKKLTVEEDESSIWPVETPYHRAVDCTVDAEIECDIDEISRLASSKSV